MDTRLSDSMASEWHKPLLPVWLAFLWICIVPFMSLYRVGPLSSFYLEAASLGGALLFVLATASLGLFRVKVPKLAWGLLAMAAFWAIQARTLNLIYPGMNDMTAVAFVVLALAAWACRSWAAEYGHERIVAVFAWSLFFGAVLQGIVAFMQFQGWAGTGIWKGILAYGTNNVSGQLAQRNHLGHYLMWGVAAAAFLWSSRRMPNWLGLLSVVLLTGILGLVNSRTILGYAAAIVLIVPFWRWRMDKQGNRTAAIMLFAALLVFAFQYAMGPLLSLFSHTGYETAVERAANSGFEGSMRQIEWNKAWLAFQSAPWFGHGWNSYGLQSFLINAEQKNFTNNILGVLFTHSHNMVLQLLAEVGLVGTLLVFAAMIAGVWRIVFRPQNPASLLLLCLIAVSLCHSMLEYPLWYIYFLTPFGLMFALAPPSDEDISDGIRFAKRCNSAVGMLALFLLGGLLRTGWTYTELAEFSQKPKNETIQHRNRRIEGLQRIAREHTMLRYYAELVLTRLADPSDTAVKPWAQEAALRALVYRPYANAYQVGLYRYRSGQTEDGRKWMQAMYYYYPYMMPFYAKKIRSLPAFRPLLPHVLADCKTFKDAPKHPSAKSCGTTL